MADGPLRAVSDAARRSQHLDAGADCPFLVSPSRLLLPRALRSLSVAYAHRLARTGTGPRLRPANDGAGDVKVARARFAGRPSRREPTQHTSSGLLSATGV